MQAHDVVDIYQQLDQIGVTLWIDGGWAVDAVIGRETRSHNDLDIAVEARYVSALRDFLEQRGYRAAAPENSSEWNFVLADEKGRKIDVHVVVLDEHDGVHGDPLDGIAYPAGSLTGEGLIAGRSVRCVSAEFLLQFKTSYPPRSIDREDVAALCTLLSQKVPETHE